MVNKFAKLNSDNSDFDPILIHGTLLNSTESYKFLVDSVPDIREDLARQKSLLSQGLSTIISAGLKVSSARKYALRPLLKTTSTGILSNRPTAEHVLGSADLASISEQAQKENHALSGVFR